MFLICFFTMFSMFLVTNISILFGFLAGRNQFLIYYEHKLVF